MTISDAIAAAAADTGKGRRFDFHLMELPDKVTTFLVRVEEFVNQAAVCQVIECPGAEHKVGQWWRLRGDSHIVRSCNEALRIAVAPGKLVSVAATGMRTKAGMRAWQITGVGDAA